MCFFLLGDCSIQYNIHEWKVNTQSFHVPGCPGRPLNVALPLHLLAHRTTSYRGEHWQMYIQMDTNILSIKVIEVVLWLLMPKELSEFIIYNNIFDLLCLESWICYFRTLRQVLWLIFFQMRNTLFLFHLLIDTFFAMWLRQKDTLRVIDIFVWYMNNEANWDVTLAASMSQFNCKCL